MLPMLPMLHISSTHLHLLSPRMLRRPPVRCRILDMDPGSRIQFGFELALYDARREAEECLVVSTCANLSALSLSLSLLPLQFSLFFSYTFLPGFFYNVSLSSPLCARPFVCYLFQFAALATSSLFFLLVLPASYSRFVVKF